MGTSKIHRGISDDTIFAAMTTQKEIAAIKIKKCRKKWDKNSCYMLEQRWTYAIPLEIIFLTPLSSWNPYKLKYHGKHVKGNPAQMNGRYGDCNSSNKKELNGITSKLYYQTPNEFYVGGNVGKGSGDTTRSVTCVMDPKGVSRRVRAAGTHVFLPYIKDVGVLRQRYPVFPVHGEGSSVWKELNALREIVMNMEGYKNMLWSQNEMQVARGAGITELQMGKSNRAGISQHTHQIELSASELEQILGGREILKTSSLAIGHQHELNIRWSGKKFIYRKCDKLSRCYDKHTTELTKIGEDDMTGV